MEPAAWRVPPGPERPAIRVNQLGYLPGTRMHATLVTPAQEPVAFAVLRAGSEQPVWSGFSQPWLLRPEPTSGLELHVIDVTGARLTSGAARIVAGQARSHTFTVSSDLYAGLANDALGVFYLLRSGCAIDDARAPGYGRPAGHLGIPPNLGDTAVPAWTGPDAERLYPGWRQPGRFDVSGGWYDAGDYGKYVVSGSVALWQLLALVDLRSRRGLTGHADFHRRLVEECRWQLDWMLRMQVPAGQPLAGMVFHGVHGTTWSPMPGWAHEDPTVRVLHRPSTAATLHLAAVAAKASRLLRREDPGYARRLLVAATTAYAAAQSLPHLVAPDDDGVFGGGPYGDAALGDDFYWAAAELWLATGQPRFLSDLTAAPAHHADLFDPAGFDYDNVGAIARLDLATGPPELPDHDRVRGSVVAAAELLADLQAAQAWGQPYAPATGWAWGSNGRLLNNAVVLAAAHELAGEPRFHQAVATGMDYLLGRNALGQSYVTGYGIDFSHHQRTRQFGHDLDAALPPPPPGALAGGPNAIDYPGFPSDSRLAGLPPQCRYLDEPTSETTNDICVRWNAPLVFICHYLDTAR